MNNMPFHPIPPIYYSKNYEEEIRKIKMEIELLKEKIKELDKKNNNMIQKKEDDYYIL